MGKHPVPEIEEWIIVDEEEGIPIDLSVAGQYLPKKIVSTLFDSLFLDGNYNKKIGQQLTEQDKVSDAISGGALYGTRIQKPWFGTKKLPFYSLDANVHGAVVNTSDRHILDSIIATGRMFDQELVSNNTLGTIIKYHENLCNRKNPGSTIYDLDYACIETKMALHNKVFSDQYFYFLVEVEKLFPMIPIAVNPPNRKKFRERLNRLGLTEFRVTFFDEEDKDLYPNSNPKFKLLEPAFYPFTNLAGKQRQKKQIKDNYFTHLIVGVGAGYIKSLSQNSTVNRKKFIASFAGITNKGNLLDFVKWLHSNRPTYIVNKSIKEFIKDYYQTKAYRGNTYITSKVNTTFKEFIAESNREAIEECLNCQFCDFEYNNKGQTSDVRLVMKESN